MAGGRAARAADGQSKNGDLQAVKPEEGEVRQK